MKKIPKDQNWHYLKWLGIIVVSILVFGIIYNFDTSLSVLSMILKVLSPIFIGLFIAIILNIPVTFFENKVFRRLTLRNGRIWSKIKRTVSISLSLACFFLISAVLLSYILPKLGESIKDFFNNADGYMQNLTERTRELVKKFDLPFDHESIDFSWGTITSFLTKLIGESTNDVIQTTLNAALNVFVSLWNVILGFILSIYIIASKESLSKLLKGFLYSIASEQRVTNIINVLTLTKKAFEGFIAGQCIEAVLIGSLTFIGMTIFRFPHALIVSFIIGLTAFIPIFGAITGAVIGAFLILLVEPIKALWFLIFIIILQQIESNVLYPKFMGQQIGLPSLWVLVSVIIGGELFGIPGIILSVPLCSVLYTLLHEWILKRLREKRLCRQNATHIPENPSLLTEEEFLSSKSDDDESANTVPTKEKNKKKPQQSKNAKTRKGNHSKKSKK